MSLQRPSSPSLQLFSFFGILVSLSKWTLVKREQIIAPIAIGVRLHISWPAHRTNNFDVSAFAIDGINNVKRIGPGVYLMERAGYITKGPTPRLTGRLATFANKELTAEEERELLKFLGYIRSQKKG